MRRDVCYHFAAKVQDVYRAYLTAAGNDKFRRECREEPYHTLTFGLNFSAKYNMNGGSCTIHLIPYQGGTAADLRFSIAQLAGARYERYAQDLTNDAVAVLHVPGRIIQLNIEEFLNENNKVTPQKMASAAPVVHAAPVKPAAPAAPAQASTYNAPAAPPAVSHYYTSGTTGTQHSSRYYATPTSAPLSSHYYDAPKAASPAAPAAAPVEKPVTAPAARDQVCKTCGSALLPDATFCFRCGAKVTPPEQNCPHCGRTLPNDAVFCAYCGSKL